MEVRYQIVLYIGVVVCLGLIFSLFFRRKKKEKYEGGKRIAGTFYLEELPYYKRRVTYYKMMRAGCVAACGVAVILSFFIVARPYKEDVINEEKYSRDILLCMDISTSVDELNLRLVDEMKETVSRLKGERIGIVIFNTSPVLLMPLTDDYDYIMQELDTIEYCLESRLNTDAIEDDSYIMSGTLVGNEELGSSLIGDGLAAAACDFTETNEKRSRFIIFSSDNDLAGEPRVTLEEAASLCMANGVVVYGIGTENMREEDMQQMRECVEGTGGFFFLEEKDGGMEQIVAEIDQSEQRVIEGDKRVVRTDIIEIPFIMLLISVSMVIIFTKYVGRR